MSSSVKRGNYYKKKTQEYLQKLGYTVQLTEFVSSRPIGGGRMIWTKKDVFGSDGIAMNGKEIIFWNAKSTIQNNKGVTDMKKKGGDEFKRFPFPDCVKRQLYIWEPRKQPVIIDCV